MGILSRGTEREREITREVVREIVGSSEATLRLWFREEVERLLRRPDLEEVCSAQAEGLLREILDGDPGLLRRSLEHLVSHAVAREVLAARTRDDVAWGDWTRAFALEGRKLVREPLPPAASWAASSTWEEIPADLLPSPIEERLARDPWPLPRPEDRQGYYRGSHLDYWGSGLVEEQRILATLRRHGIELAPGDGLLDLGCASGRVLRHFACQEEGLLCWGADIDRGAIDWMHRHLGRSVRAFQCTVLPSLPLPDASLSLVYGLSVFTHIDEFEHAWLAELRRVLRPGGIAYLSIHSEQTWAQMSQGWGVYRDLLSNRAVIEGHDVTPELFQAPMPAERMVFRWRTDSLNNTNVFTSKEYVQRVWARFLEVLEILPQASGYQDVVVLRRT